MQGVGGLVLLVLGDDDAARRQRLLGLGVAHLGHREGGRDGHDAGRHEGLGVEPQADVGDQHGAGDGGEAAGHDLVDLGEGQVRHERADQHGALALADEGGGGGDDGLGARDAQGPEEEGGELADEPLDQADVVQQLDEGDEEDDGRHDARQEPRQRRDGVVGQELDAVGREAQQRAGHLGDEGEDVVAGLAAQHEDGDDELGQHASDDGVPGDLAPVARGGGEHGDHDQQAEQRDGPVGARVLARLGGDHGADEEDGDGDGGGEGLVQLGRNGLVSSVERVAVDGLGRVHNDRDGDPERDDADGDGDVQQRRLEPPEVPVVAVPDEAMNPPAGNHHALVSAARTHTHTFSRTSTTASHREADTSISSMLMLGRYSHGPHNPDEDMDLKPESPVYRPGRPLALPPVLVVDVSNTAALLVLVGTHLAHLVVRSRRVSGVLVGGLGEHDIVLLVRDRGLAVVDVRVVVLVGNVQGRVRVDIYVLLGRAVVAHHGRCRDNSAAGAHRGVVGAVNRR